MASVHCIIFSQFIVRLAGWGDVLHCERAKGPVQGQRAKTSWSKPAWLEQLHAYNVMGPGPYENRCWYLVQRDFKPYYSRCSFVLNVWKQEGPCRNLHISFFNPQRTKLTYFEYNNVCSSSMSRRMFTYTCVNTNYSATLLNLNIITRKKKTVWAYDE